MSRWAAIIPTNNGINRKIESDAELTFDGVEQPRMDKWSMDKWTRSLKSIYRKEPVVSFMVTAGAVNVAIAGFTEHWVLMSVGLSVVGVAVALYVRQMQTRRRPIPRQHRASVYLLPPSSESLPLLNISKKNPPS